MHINYNSLERSENAENIGDWSKCTCKECDRVFLQKRTIIAQLKPFMEQFKDLPIDIEFTSYNIDGLMSVVVLFTQTKDIHEAELQKCLEKKG